MPDGEIPVSHQLLGTGDAVVQGMLDGRLSHLGKQTLAEVEVNRRMFANCQQCIVVADHNKVGRASLVGINDLTQVDHLVTDVKADEQEVRLLQNREIDVSFV